MQEELLRKTHQKEVAIEEAHEKARRITETLSQISDGDEAKAKSIDMLIDVQNQLLDVFAITQVRLLLRWVSEFLISLQKSELCNAISLT